VIAAIGAFDGFHLGHQALLDRAIEKANEVGSSWGVITFSNHPDRYFGKRASGEGNDSEMGSGFKSIFVLREQRLLERFFEIPNVRRINFTREIAEMAPEEFLDYIGNGFGASGLVVGEDFRFGKDRSGNPKSLTESCARRGWSADVVPMRLAADGRPICSTLVREAVISGEMRRAWELLGYPFFSKNRVVHGFNRGTSLGFPTANIEIHPHKIGIRHGVYATLASVGGVWLTGAANVGLNPTFNDIDSPRFEVNLLGYEGDLYGSEIAVFMLDHIRDEIQFSNTDDLAAQVTRDAETIKKLSAKALSEHKDLWDKFSLALSPVFDGTGKLV
jgi:riboflavin kinase/FMN adenylyltransferase